MDLYEQSLKYNCEGVKCLEEQQRKRNLDELREAINCGAYNIRQREIRNVDHERPMMFPEYRFQHLNYCTIKHLNGYAVCNDCTSCGFNKNIQFKK
jgi:hypothetical protein